MGMGNDRFTTAPGSSSIVELATVTPSRSIRSSWVAAGPPKWVTATRATRPSADGSTESWVMPRLVADEPTDS